MQKKTSKNTNANKKEVKFNFLPEKGSLLQSKMQQKCKEETDLKFNLHSH